VTAVAQLRATLPDLIDLTLDRLDTDTNPPAIRFELRLPGAASADASTETGQRST
jgi:hypothetical protein